jgi:hypothetical protein
MKEMAERQLKALKAAQKNKNQDFWSQKWGKVRPEPSHAIYFHILTAACAGCGEVLEDDCVQFGSWLEWWHEDCSTGKGGGSFLCDRC